MQLWGSALGPSFGTAGAFKNTMGTVTSRERLSVPLEGCGRAPITNGNQLHTAITTEILFPAILQHVSGFS